MSCSLCGQLTDKIIWRGSFCQIIFPASNATFATLRIIWLEHVREYSQLTKEQRYHLSDVIATVEAFLLNTLNPDKVNIASLGNVVAHLHWHIIPRWHDDEFFPDSIWAKPRRPSIQRVYPVSLEAWLGTAQEYFNINIS